MIVRMQENGAFTEDVEEEGNQCNIVAKLRYVEITSAAQSQAELDSHVKEENNRTDTHDEDWDTFIVRYEFTTSAIGHVNLKSDLIDRLGLD